MDACTIVFTRLNRNFHLSLPDRAIRRHNGDGTAKRPTSAGAISVIVLRLYPYASYIIIIVRKLKLGIGAPQAYVYVWIKSRALSGSSIYLQAICYNNATATGNCCGSPNPVANDCNTDNQSVARFSASVSLALVVMIDA